MYASDVFIGIDPSGYELAIAALPQNQIWKASHGEWGLTELVKRLAALRPRVVVIESTRGMERPVQSLLEEAGLSVHIVSSAQIRNFLNRQGFAKTDAERAVVLARYGQSVAPQIRREKDRGSTELESLLTRRCQLLEMLTTEKDRVRTQSKRVRGDVEAHISWLEKCLRLIDKDTSGLVKKMPIWSQQKRPIQIVPGAGPNWIISLLALLPQVAILNLR